MMLANHQETSRNHQGRYPTTAHKSHQRHQFGTEETTNLSAKLRQQERSVNTSSGSSSGYTSHHNHSVHNHHNHNFHGLNHQYSHHDDELYPTTAITAAAIDTASVYHPLQRAPTMIPMMIDDDDDGRAELDESHLIDDTDLDLNNSVEDNNNISELYGTHHHHHRVDALGSYLAASNSGPTFYARPPLEDEDDEDGELATRSPGHLAHYQLLQHNKQPAIHSYSNNQHLRHLHHHHYQPQGSFSYIQPPLHHHIHQQQLQQQEQPASLSEFQSRELTLLLAQQRKNLLNQQNLKANPSGRQQQEVRLPQAKAEGKRSAASKSSASAGVKEKKMQSGSRQQLTSGDYLYHQPRRQNNNGASSRSTRKQSSRSGTPSGAAVVAEKPAIGWCGNFAKLLLFIANLLFWSAGIALGAWGILSLVDDHKYNLSQLLVFEPSSRMSLFQLLSWSFITLGCITILVGLCGCSAILKNNRWILGLYIFLILAIFALDLATGLLAIIFQERLVANVRLRLVNKLRSDYGVHASFTAAIDYIQTRFECCGLEGHFDFDQSLWRLQRLGGFDATVARTCCHLRNTFDDQAHINPRPVNESMCQSTDVRFHQSYRYRKGCMDELEKLIRQKIWTFTVGCGVVGAIILLSLIFATCFCRSIPSTSSRKSSSTSNLADNSNHYDKKQSGGSISTKNAHHHHHHQRHH